MPLRVSENFEKIRIFRKKKFVKILFLQFFVISSRIFYSPIARCEIVDFNLINASDLIIRVFLF